MWEGVFVPRKRLKRLIVIGNLNSVRPGLNICERDSCVRCDNSNYITYLASNNARDGASIRNLLITLCGMG